jgi:hypothetical protein
MSREDNGRSLNADVRQTEVGTEKRLDGRLDANAYRDDVQCQLRLKPDPRDEGREPIEGWISERLLARLRHLALAYELPLLARLPSDGSRVFPEVQIPSLEEELAFVFSIVTDQVLLDAIAPLREMIRVATHHPRGWSLVVDAPVIGDGLPDQAL